MWITTTKIWAVKDSLKRVVDYASYPEKTEYSGLANALHYAENGVKTELCETVHLVSGLHCRPEQAWDDMRSIQEHFGKTGGTGIGSKIMTGLSQSSWCDPSRPIYSLGLVLYIVLVVFFAYFYTSITFNPIEISNNMKRQGGFIPGIRPGKPTTEYLSRILNYIVFIGAVGLIIVCVIPIFFNGMFGANVSFGGTSIIIIVGVVLETLKQIESQMLVRYYKGFLND